MWIGTWAFDIFGECMYDNIRFFKMHLYVFSTIMIITDCSLWHDQTVSDKHSWHAQKVLCPMYHVFFGGIIYFNGNIARRLLAMTYCHRRICTVYLFILRMLPTADFSNFFDHGALWQLIRCLPDASYLGSFSKGYVKA